MRDGRGTGSRSLRLAGSTALLLLVVTGCAAVPGGTGSASCAAQEIDLGSSDLRPGGQIELSVDWMTARCEDTGGTNQPAEDIDVTITPAGSPEARHLGTIESASGPRFTAAGTFPIPDDLPAGDALLAVTSSVGERASAKLPVTLAAK